MTFCLTCHPAFDYARTPTKRTSTRTGPVFSTAALALGLATTLPLKQDERESAPSLRCGGENMRPVSCGKSTKGNQCGAAVGTHAGNMFETTVQFWHEWLSHSRYTGRWREMVSRSALALKLLDL